MAPTPLRRLIAMQAIRLSEIELINTQTISRRAEMLNKHIVQSRIDAINGIWSEMRNTHLEITSRDDSVEDAYVTKNEFVRMRDIWEATLDFLLNLLSELDVPPNANDSTLPLRVSEDSTNDFAPRPAKLPKLDLPTFSGAYEDWDSFSDLFKSLVHNAPRVNDATKLQYLKSCLKGTAADLIKDVPITSVNYISAWKALQSRFCKPRLTISGHINTLLNMPFLKRDSDTELRSFIDEAQRIYRALQNLKMPVDKWDTWFIEILSARLSPKSRMAWEAEISAKEQTRCADEIESNCEKDVYSQLPKFSEFSKFLEKRSQALSVISAPEKRTNIKVKIGESRKIHHSSTLRPMESKSLKCAFCKNNHYITKCPKFRSQSVFNRREKIKRLHLCFNCMGQHMHRECRSTGRCNFCGGKHHTMLHNETRPRMQSNADKAPAPSSDTSKEHEQSLTGESKIQAHSASLIANKHFVILATAQIKVIGPDGAHTRVRALLDQGSEASFVSESVAQLLKLPRHNVRVPLSGLGATEAGVARAKTHFRLESLTDENFSININALILPRLTSKLPARDILDIPFKDFSEITLADPHFYLSDKIDVIIGADIYGQLLLAGLKIFNYSKLVAQNTSLGWIISGSAQSSMSRRAVSHATVGISGFHCATDDTLYETLQRFWAVEELPPRVISLKPEDEECEKLFNETHRRDANGRYIVNLPIKGELPRVSLETRRIALESLASLHRRFSRDPKLEKSYIDFMDTYEKLGHMKRVPIEEIENDKSWYLPHHPVIQMSSSQWKLRVVFDASRRTRSQYRLNDFLMAGPPLQKDLGLILLNWRRYRYVFTADIVKMFRQIQVATENQDSQRIIWSPNAKQSPIDYRLTTVTYGTSCAPYLAIRTLLKLANDERSRFPLGASCIEHNTYVDDTFAGANDISCAIAKRTELIQILNSAGLELNKWAANHASLLPSDTPQAENEVIKQIDRDFAVKTLGVYWSPSIDSFNFSVLKPDNVSESLTKRSVLSNISRLFDPLGWISPVTITAKILMQDLWILKVDWDTVLPTDICTRWLEYCNSLEKLPTLSITRWIGMAPDTACQLHGFSDASARAYAAAVYLRIDEGNGNHRVSLLAAKTKVAPVKTVTIPNLELCGAVLLVKLVLHLRQLNFLKNVPLFMWVDSQIVLNWLSKHPRQWKTFVANRVSLIQTELPSATWSYVPTKSNPADIATRGLKPTDLRDVTLWWHGPSWLSLTSENWPQQPVVRVTHAQIIPPEPEILTKFSSLTRLLRVVGFCLRPLTNLRRRKNGLLPLSSSLTAQEILYARSAVIKLAQYHAFASDIKLLQEGKSLPKNSAIVKLNPILSRSDGLLCVGGRLTHSTLTREQKHPPILPRRSALSRLFVNYAHCASLHGGPTLTCNVLIQNVWILGMKGLVNTTVHNCLKCQRIKPRFAHQLMGNLPAARLMPSRPFTISGLDYAGPFQVRLSKGRGCKTYKGYIALFICFVTRAIHLELVSDLTTGMFICAYKRFISRRGICKQIFSDNASTFKGADAELKGMFSAASKYYQEISATLANDGTSWTFIPPTTPHYGGLWEAGVKSTKHHLRRAFNEHSLTFEEFSTILSEIEACLNSRPLSPLSSNVDDLNVLTPAHFLIGATSGLIPDEEPPSMPENRLTRYQLLQRIRNQFWRQWSREYMQHLQERTKWRNAAENFQVGQLVLLRDDRYPPAKWPLGRVTEIHPGPDGLVRVVTVKTAVGTFKRHIVRICPLSLPSNEEK